MDSALTDEDFRARVRDWLRANIPADMAQRSRTAVHPTREDMLGITAVLAKAGWSVPHWAPEHGGPGWSPLRRQIFQEELILAGAPSNNIQGVSLVGPVIYTFGTQAQKERYLSPIREGREFWCQGFSEPNSGSDLASLRTRAVREGDVYVVNGQKIWTSQAMLADMMFCLVRTDPDAKPQKGISFLLIPMTLPGLTVRPIESIDEGESLCEVFFDSVRVPAANLVGEEGKGWDYAKFLLGNERVQTAEVPRNKLYLARLREIAAHEFRDGVPLLKDPVFRERVASAEIDFVGLESAVLEALEADDDSALTPSSLKVLGCELMQRTLGLQVEALGPYGAAFYPHPGHGPQAAVPGPAHAAGVAAEFLFRRAATIYGGSSEVQKNIISKLLFLGQEGPAPRLTEDQGMLRESARRLAEGAARGTQRARTRDASPEQARAAWQRLADTGFAGLGIPESAGGAGGSLADLAVVCETFGSGLSDEPFVGLAVLPGQVLAALDLPDTLRAELVGALVSGQRITAVAHEEPGSATPGARTVARRNGSGYAIEGLKCVVPGGKAADRFLLSAHVEGEGFALFLVDASAPGLHARAYRTIDGRGVCDLVLEHVHVPEAARLGSGEAAREALERAIDHALVMSCADAVGAMGEALRITRDYLAVRKQFGSTLSEFQALRHRLAEMYAELAVSRALLKRAVEALQGDVHGRRRLAAAAKARIGRAATFVANQSVQLHGGIGMTEEYVIGRYYKRLFTFEALMGNSAHHTRRFAGLDEAAALPPR
ncbi:MAG TPA: acyl-CoA dehydrogenase family protein [Quisquiliibacterium sp.]|nr:acyl-CoA dehydrogenase family protein [Quisquiliibacterium sp.]